jgi:Na+/H+ antiporter NhaA
MTIFFTHWLRTRTRNLPRELSTQRRFIAYFAAAGGMLVPKDCIYTNYGTAAHSGAGIPMANCLALGILSLTRQTGSAVL